MFIKKTISISPQNTLANEALREYTEHVGNKYHAIEPSYQGLIPGNILRRMGRSNKLGVAAGNMLLAGQDYGLDGIIMASTNGGIQDSLKFLNQIMDYEEGTLLPTNFIQSAPNTVAGNIAILDQLNKYNTTHVQTGTAFENSLLDAKMQFHLGHANNLLVGAVEEISEFNYNIEESAGYFKVEETTSTHLLQSKTEGTVIGEGANLFILEKQAKGKSVEIVDTISRNFLHEEVVLPCTKEFLKTSNYGIENIDGLVLGYSGDTRTNAFYNHLEASFTDANIYTFKNLCGEFATASSFSLWMANELLLGKNMYPEAIKKQVKEKPKTMLIYNNYLGKHHGWILVRLT